jgi:glutathione S-transferase
VRWALHEINLPFEEVRLDYQSQEHKSDAFLQKNPFGIIPALEIDGKVLVESGAICQNLAEQYPQAKLAPEPESPLRTAYHQWCYFACSTLEQATIPLFRAKRTGTPLEAEKEKELVEAMNRVLQTLSNSLEGKTYLLGDTFTTADILVSSTLDWVKRIGMLTNFPTLGAYLARLEQRNAAIQSRVFTSKMEI